MRNLFKYGLAVIRNKKLLVLREKNKSKYLLPGGRPEEGEDIEKALSREIKEELNVAIRPGSVRFYRTFEDVAANEPDTIIKISLSIGEIEGTPEPSSEIQETAWIGSNHSLELAPSIKNKILPALIKDGIID